MYYYSTPETWQSSSEVHMWNAYVMFNIFIQPSQTKNYHNSLIVYIFQRNSAPVKENSQWVSQASQSVAEYFLYSLEKAAQVWTAFSLIVNMWRLNMHKQLTRDSPTCCLGGWKAAVTPIPVFLSGEQSIQASTDPIMPSALPLILPFHCEGLLEADPARDPAASFSLVCWDLPSVAIHHEVSWEALVHSSHLHTLNQAVLGVFFNHFKSFLLPFPTLLSLMLLIYIFLKTVHTVFTDFNIHLS